MRLERVEIQIDSFRIKLTRENLQQVLFHFHRLMPKADSCLQPLNIKELLLLLPEVSIVLR